MKRNDAVVKVVIDPSDEDGKCGMKIISDNKSIDMVQVRALARFTRVIHDEYNKMLAETIWIDERIQSSKDEDFGKKK